MRSFKLSQAGEAEVDILASHRKMMWQEIHPEYGRQVRATASETKQWISQKLSQGRLIGFIVRVPDGKVAGSGCIWLREEQPRPTSMSLEVPYLMSMYTEKEYRRKGVARLIVREAMKWCRARSYDRLVLHASREGKPVYEGLGFEPSNEMRFKFRKLPKRHARSVSAAAFPSPRA